MFPNTMTDILILAAFFFFIILNYTKGFRNTKQAIPTCRQPTIPQLKADVGKGAKFTVMSAKFAKLYGALRALCGLCD